MPARRRAPAPHPEDWLPIDLAEEWVQKALVGPVNEYLRLFAQTGNEVHFWRAWLALRKTMPDKVPAAMLRHVDAIADAACREKRARKRADAEFDRRARMQAVWDEACRRGGTYPERGVRPPMPDGTYEAVAARLGDDPDNLKQAWSLWWKSVSRKAERDAAGADLVAVWGSVSRRA